MRPYLLSCASKNPKLAGTSISSLQRLIVASALAKETLKDVLDVLRDCTGLAQEIQLKILQVLPSLLQNYTEYLAGDLLATALHICFLLFASKPAVIANTAAATLQQLVVSAFGKAAQEDELAAERDVVAEVPIEDGSVSVRSAALDAYRLLNDICLLTEGHNPTFLYPASMPQNFGLEILESIMSNYAETISGHPELIHIIRIRLMPFIIRVLSERVMFSTTVRSIRLLPVIFGNLLSVLSSECEMVLSLLNHMLDPDAAVLWKRVLCMEVFRGIHSEATLVRSIYSLFDEGEGKRNIIQDHMGALVRLASEKPAVIGLGQQSSVPASSGQTEDEMDEMAALQADGVAGTFGVAMTLRSSTAPGISTRLSTMRVPCFDQLDKNEPPPIPPAYLYTLALACMNSFSEGLTRFLLPFTVPTEAKTKRKQKQPPESEGTGTPIREEAEDEDDEDQRTQLRRAFSSSLPTRVPVNPLSLSNHVLYHQIRTSAHMAEACWPALLAAYSTFFHAALDSEYFHALVRSFQKFTQISGLLRLSTPRDAFLTTLGKNAVPSGLISMPSMGHESPAIDPRDVRRGSGAVSAKEGPSGPLSAVIDKGKRSVELGRASLNTRNLLCLRALLHLGIALGPVLQAAWSIILETLQAADLIIHHITSQRRQARSAPVLTANDTDILGDIGNEIAAARVAATRMFESSADLPNSAFLDVVRSLCKLLKRREEHTSLMESGPSSTPTSKTHTPKSSISKPLVTGQVSDPRARIFIIENLDKVAQVNSVRLLQQQPSESGWQMTIEPMIEVAASSTDLQLRTRAAHVTCILIDLTASSAIDEDLKPAIRYDGLQALKKLIGSLYKHVTDDKASRSCEIDIHCRALETLKSALERYGDSLARGWDSVFAIIASVYELPGDLSNEDSILEVPMAISPKLVRSSFGSLQLVCSDFLAAVPSSYLGKMLRNVHLFCRQQEDFNIALTATTLFGNVSDHVQQAPGFPQEPTTPGPDFESSVQSPVHDIIDLLLLLVNVTIDERLEIRHSAIHSVFTILESWGQKLSSLEWMELQNRVGLGLFVSNENEYKQLNQNETAVEARLAGWNEAAVLILNRWSRLFSAYICLLMREDSFQPFWAECLGHLRTLLTRQDLKVSHAVYEALEHILSAFKKDTGDDALRCSMEAWKLWKHGNPANHRSVSQTSNEQALLAYLRCLSTMYASIAGKVDSSELRAMLDQLRECAVKSETAAYSEDIDRTTSVQSEILSCIRNVDVKAPGFPSELILCLSSFVTLAQDQNGVKAGPTFIAFAKTAMDMLAALVRECRRVREIYEDGSLVVAVRSLQKPIDSRYKNPVKGKDTSTWKKATQTFVRLMGDSVPFLVEEDFRDTTAVPIWEENLACFKMVISVDSEACSKASDLLDDQESDIETFGSLYGLLVPALGCDIVPSRLRKLFAASVFESSIIHEPHPDDLPRAEGELLGNLGSVHVGRVRTIPPARRSKLCYILLDKLFDLVAHHDGSDERVRLAQSAAPYLILRVSLTLKAYIFDQPLRGCMPLPASQRKELLHMLPLLVDFDCEPRAFSGSGRPPAQRGHLRLVYGLVMKAIGVARRDQVLHAALMKVLNAASEDLSI